MDIQIIIDPSEQENNKISLRLQGRMVLGGNNEFILMIICISIHSLSFCYVSALSQNSLQISFSENIVF